MKLLSKNIFIVMLFAIICVVIAIVLPRFYSFRNSKIPVWTLKEAEQNGFIYYKIGPSLNNSSNTKTIVNECINDFKLMHCGDSRLLGIYETDQKEFIIIKLENYRDKWFNSVVDSVIAYAYDKTNQKFIGKFWVPMA